MGMYIYNSENHLNYFKKETVVCGAKLGRKHSITVVKISIP
jgi:hypothetical protein